MTVRRVNPEVLAPPTGFSHAVVAEGSTIVLLAGQTALNSDNVIEGEGIVNQTEKALTNLRNGFSGRGWRSIAVGQTHHLLHRSG